MNMLGLPCTAQILWDLQVNHLLPASYRSMGSFPPNSLPVIGCLQYPGLSQQSWKPLGDQKPISPGRLQGIGFLVHFLNQRNGLASSSRQSSPSFCPIAVDLPDHSRVWHREADNWMLAIRVWRLMPIT